MTIKNKKREAPHNPAFPAVKCPHNNACLGTGEREGAESCPVDYYSSRKNLLFLKGNEFSPSCPYKEKHGDRQVCSCPGKTFRYQQRIDGTILFKQCLRCQTAWLNCSDFLSDPAVALRAYQVSFEQLETGIFLFVHSCHTTLSIPAGYFSHLYDGPVYEDRATGTDDCPEYCLRAYNLEPCPVRCECAYIREIMQIIRNWPKKPQ